MAVKSEASLYLAVDLVGPVVHALECGTAVVHSRAAPIDDRTNEDGAGVLRLGEGHVVLGVADGVGGSRAAKEAARAALETLAATLQAGGAHSVLDAFDAANQAVCALGLGAATTLAVAEIQGAELRTYHVGDSRVLVVGQRGKRKHQTVDHSPVGYGVEAGLIDEREAIDHAERHLVSNVLGSVDMSITVGPKLTLAPFDTVALGSDGLFDNLYVEEVEGVIRRGDLQEAAASALARCRERMEHPRVGEPSKVDDATLVLYRGGGR
ncbi:MAG: protein phosphatase 2C domain-containing protein [Planctomycetes bacterium]|nr:protein phosphatase 2C domain-containing protein [Planctomycetota bacterium]